MHIDPEDLPSDDELDPDYSEGESDADSLPWTMGADRAEWIRNNVEAVEELYTVFKGIGDKLFGPAFFQTGNVTDFGKFIYRHTTPISE